MRRIGAPHLAWFRPADLVPELRQRPRPRPGGDAPRPRQRRLSELRRRRVTSSPCRRDPAAPVRDPPLRDSPMPRFFFDLRAGSRLTADPTGTELRDWEAARAFGLRRALVAWAELDGSAPMEDVAYLIGDGSRVSPLTLPFCEAFEGRRSARSRPEAARRRPALSPDAVHRARGPVEPRPGGQGREQLSPPPALAC
jgi:hypothetical protein